MPRFLNALYASFLIFLMVNLSACELKDCCENCCTDIDTSVDIHYQTQTGENLINSSNEFDESNIKVYYKNGDNYDFMRNESLDASGFYKLDTFDTGEISMRILTSNIYEQNKSTTLIELNENVVDTLVGEYKLTGNSEVIQRVWINGIEKLLDQPIVVRK